MITKFKIHISQRLILLLLCLFLMADFKSQTSCTTSHHYQIGEIDIDVNSSDTITLCANREIGCIANYQECCIGDPQCYTYITNTSWDFGDGSPLQYTGLIGPGEIMQSVSHAYTANTSYIITLVETYGETVSTYTIPVVIETCCKDPLSVPVIDANKGGKIESLCSTKEVQFQIKGVTNPNPSFNSIIVGATYLWNFGDGSVSTLLDPVHTYASPGSYTVTVVATYPDCDPFTITKVVNIQGCVSLPCEDCLGTFQPSPGKYVVSLWVKEDLSALPKTYINAHIEISFSGDPLVYNFYPNPAKNKIIDSWQKIEEEFLVPTSATDIQINLLNASNTVDAYYDDIRIFPVDGQMKSYVYDPTTLKLTATLDENNYATFYEYDEEGKLIRVKKETEKGIVTIQESREGNKKK